MNFDSPVVWHPVPALPVSYAIASDEDVALAAARQLFAPWLVEKSDDSVALRWNIAPAADARHSWNARNDSSHGDNALLRHQTLADLLTHIEYDSICHLVKHLPDGWLGLHGALLSREFAGRQRAAW